MNERNTYRNFSNKMMIIPNKVLKQKPKQGNYREMSL